jgi:cyclophilin family peptidyl-prolyl cis-trans isomerase
MSLCVAVGEILSDRGAQATPHLDGKHVVFGRVTKVRNTYNGIHRTPLAQARCAAACRTGAGGENRIARHIETSGNLSQLVL